MRVGGRARSRDVAVEPPARRLGRADRVGIGGIDLEAIGAVRGDVQRVDSVAGGDPNVGTPEDEGSPRFPGFGMAGPVGPDLCRERKAVVDGGIEQGERVDVLSRDSTWTEGAS